LESLGLGILNHHIGCMSDPNSPLLKCYMHIFHGVVKSFPMYSFFPLLDNRWSPLRASYYDSLDKFTRIWADLIEERKKRLIAELGTESEKRSDDDRDLLSLLIKANLETGQVTDREVRDNINNFFLAGHDTTATTLTIASYYLAKFPEIQEKVRQEVISVIGESASSIATTAIPTQADLKRMPYLTAVIKEALRIHPPLSILNPRKLQTDVVLSDGRQLPKGAYMSINIWGINHDPENWPDPERFFPERHLDENPSHDPLAFLTFSSGKRICLGMQFAWTELRVVLSMLLARYKWTLPEGSIHDDGLKFGATHLLAVKPMDLVYERL